MATSVRSKQMETLKLHCYVKHSIIYGVSLIFLTGSMPVAHVYGVTICHYIMSLAICHLGQPF